MKVSTLTRSAILLACLPLLVLPGVLHGQASGPTRHERAAALADRLWSSPLPQDSAVAPAGGLTLLRVAKWGALIGAAGAGVYGFVQNHRADDRYRELEEFCQAEMFRCAQRTAAGEYEDPAFENRYQKVRSLDRRSHTALVLSQIGVASSVVLFLLDLGNAGPPTDIPYVPSGLEIAPAKNGLKIGVRLNVSGSLDR